MKVLVTGGAGFIGSNFIRFLLAEKGGWTVVNVDSLTYAGNLASLQDVADSRSYEFIRGDITDEALMDWLFREKGPDAVVHLAAETHVDRSIDDPSPFLTTNVLGTKVLLDCALRHGTGRFLNVSTDEVYGSLDPGDPAAGEENPLRPGNPYSASKAAADHLVGAWHRTHGLDTVIARCTNNYGPRQFPEKFIPLMIENALAGQALPLYGDGSNIRDWIHVSDHCSALAVLLESGAAGEIYNIGSHVQLPNLQVAEGILDHLGKPRSLIRFVQDRPGHDLRYAVDTGKLEGLGWSPSTGFAEGLAATISWYVENRAWVEGVVTGEYREFYERNYAKRLR